MRRSHDVLSTIGAVALCRALGLPSQPTLAQSRGEPVIYLDQAWSQADREWHYNFSQGSSTREM